MINYTFGKKYSLKSKIEIDRLFESGNRVSSYPFTVFFKESNDESGITPFKIVVSAPKRTFRKAVKRNRIKRIMRESIRLNKNKLEDYLNTQNKRVNLFLIYSASEEIEHSVLNKKTVKLFDKIIKHLDVQKN